jgi:hypothetical protein
VQFSRAGGPQKSRLCLERKEERVGRELEESYSSKLKRQDVRDGQIFLLSCHFAFSSSWSGRPTTMASALSQNGNCGHVCTARRPSRCSCAIHYSGPERQRGREWVAPRLCNQEALLRSFGFACLRVIHYSRWPLMALFGGRAACHSAVSCSCYLLCSLAPICGSRSFLPLYCATMPFAVWGPSLLLYGVLMHVHTVR